MSEPKKTGLELLREPFPPHMISKLPKPFKKDSPKGKCPECGGFHGLPAAHLDYVGHAALTARLLEADIKWDWTPLSLTPDGQPCFDKSGGLWIQLTVCGMTRIGYGNAETSQYKEVGSREKEVIGDALRNAAMRFGAALDLWHKGDLHGDDEKPQEVVISKEPKMKLIKPSETAGAISQLKKTNPINHAPKQPVYVTDSRIKMLYFVCKEAQWTEEQLRAIVKAQFGLESNRLLNREQFELLIAHIKAKKSPVGEIGK